MFALLENNKCMNRISMIASRDPADRHVAGEAKRSET